MIASYNGRLLNFKRLTERIVSLVDCIVFILSNLTLLHSEGPKLYSLLHSERPKLRRVLTLLRAIG